ncbi:hypothetical protein AHAS_Ahas18G0154300 [Arachis hypogaea]
MDSCDSFHRQSVSMDECDQSTEKRSMKEILESQHEDKEMGYALQQVEEERILEEEEIVEDLGEVEQGVSAIIEDK